MAAKRKNASADTNLKLKQVKTSTDTEEFDCDAVYLPTIITDEDRAHRSPEELANMAFDDEVNWGCPAGQRYPSIKFKGFTEPLLSRLNNIWKYIDCTQGFYYVTTLPETLKFGHDQAFDMSNFLVCSNNTLVNVWILGRIMAHKFIGDEENIWPDQKSYNMDKPAKEFTSVYDATEEMKPKKMMKRLPASTLKKGDLVIAEMCVKKRFDRKDEHIPKKDCPHTISFQLQTVYFLQKGTKPVENNDGISYNF
ncbi:hypothetical protein CALCODRAFT_510038 [Calocera cornea HHB12733]|uniref:Uncharacterized protein n=1 Tax=Calocera cornea HHB12733 TaxID=1353952 RepID=A0A165EVI4_9BASI|nr:hypothetical protein CALCODRAFT_510038 [Calocera cornea HHB12733]